MKLTLRIIGTIAVVLLGIGVILYILMQWGALVEYHAFEWRGIVTAKSPLVRATENFSYFFLSIGLPFGVTAIVLKIITSVREDKKIREEQLRRARADQHKQPPEKQQ